MAAGLQKTLVPIFVGGGIDTKIDPRLMPAGSLLELENMRMLRTGELRPRDGFSKLSAALQPILTGQNLFTGLRGDLQTIVRKWNSVSYTWASATRYGTAPVAGWSPHPGPGVVPPHPTFSASVRGVTGMPTGVSQDMADGDIAISGSSKGVLFNEGSVAPSGGMRFIFTDATTGKVAIHTQNVIAGFFTSNGRPGVIIPATIGGSDSFCIFYADGSATPSLVVSTCQGGTFNAQVTLAANAVVTAQPWIDAKVIPSSGNIAVAWRATAGGVSVLVYNPSTAAITVGPVNIAAADASFTLGWLDDQLSTGSLFLATAGSTAGVVTRLLNPATLAVTATNVMDATATTGVRNITGHVDAGTSDYTVLWDASGSSTIYDKTYLGRWIGGSPFAGVFYHGWSLASRSFKTPDTKYSIVACYDSPVSPAFALFPAYDAPGNGVANGTMARPQAMIFNGDGGGRRSQCSLSSVATFGSTYLTTILRKRKITVPGTTTPGYQGKIVQETAFTDNISALLRPRELGGTLFVPGGLLTRDDGTDLTSAVFPIPPEAPACVGALTGGGGMTASGTYSYRIVWKFADAAGRAQRSATSTTTSVTLGASDNSVQVTFQNQRIPMSDRYAPTPYVAVEIYRAGPAAAGSTVYTKVKETSMPATTAVDNFTVTDTASDATAATGEPLYTTGGVLDNYPPPAHNLLEVCGNRVGVVNAEDPVEFWPSKEYKSGSGIAFNQLLAIRVTGDGFGAITALAAMDGRWILFKSNAIYVIAGDGPNDQGSGSFSAPQAVSLTVGTTLPGSVVSTPDGIMFQSAKGIYLLDRGMGLTYLGAPVEQYTRAANVVDASLVTGLTVVRFVFASGRMLEWDYHHKRWYTHQLRVDRSGVASTIVACVNSTIYGWCYMLANGDVMQETSGVYSDVNGTTTAIVPRVGFPNLNLAGINGLQRVYGIQIVGEYVGDHTLQASAVYDLGAATEPTRSLAITSGPYRYEVLFATQKSSSMQLNLTASLAAGSGAFRLSGISLIVGMKRGSNIAYTKRLT